MAISTAGGIFGRFGLLASQRPNVRAALQQLGDNSAAYTSGTADDESFHRLLFSQSDFPYEE